MISGHVYLLSILSWGILVYQINMSFFVALHFTTRDNKKAVASNNFSGLIIIFDNKVNYF